MKRIFPLILIFIALMLQCGAKSRANDEYWQVVTKRAEKIVATLDISNVEKSARVRDLIAQQYYNLNTIHGERDARIKSVKESEWDKTAKETEIKKQEERANRKQEKLHKKYLAGLSRELTEKQIDQVKNGMTYNVLTLTYDGYLDMLPDLNEEQKDFIMKALVEAREKAMDAGSSHEKHGWFGKYKGRINNYLSAQGYDLKKAGEEWQQRLREKQ